MISKGYSLIELMVVVAIVGIISAIAYPSYQGYMTDTYQAQAAADLQLCASNLERFYSNGFTYVGADTPGSEPCTMWSPSDGPQADSRYTISFPAGTLSANDYIIRATPISEGECIQLAADGTQTTC